MAGQIKSTTAFRILTANRRDASRAAHQFGVFGVKKDGVLYAKPTATFATIEDAEAKAAAMRGFNPGKEFVVQPLVG